MKKKESFIKLIRIWGIIFFVGIGVSIVAIDIVGSHRGFKDHAEEMRADYIATQKQIIKQEVHRVVDLIAYEKSQSEMLTKRKIKSRVYEADSIAKNIYQQNRTSKGDTEIQQMILDALRPIRFEQGSGYYFVIRMDGMTILNANKPEIEEKNVLGLQDTHGKYFIKEMIKIVKQSGEGFDEYYWLKPGVEGNNFKKISFIKSFKPYSWLIGAGLYVDDVKENIKKNLLATISRIRFGKEGYIFINRLNGDALVSNGKLFSGTKKLWEVFDKNPEKMKDIFEKEYNAALKPEGDYIYYSHIKLTDPNKESPKASFIHGIPDLQWLVGAGVYLDDVETEIALMQTKLNDQIKAKMLYFILIVMGIVILFFLFFNWLSRGLKNDFKLFVSFFMKAANSNEELDRDTIKFIELDQMAEYANKMLTDRKQAEEALKESEKKYRTQFEEALDAIFVADAETGILVDCNQAALEMVGMARSELIGKHQRILHPPEETESELSKTFDQHLKEQEGQTLESQVITKTGEIKEVSIKANLFKLKGKIFLQGIFRDITERKRIEEEMIRLAAAIEQASESIIIADGPGTIQYVNPAFEQLSGYTQEEIVGQNFRILKSDKHDEPFYRKMYETISQGEIWSGRIINRMKDDTLREFETSISPIKDNTGQIVTYVSVNRDITHEVALEAQLRQSQKLESIGQLAGGVAHDFNNMLGVILGNAELALDDVPEWNPARLNLEEIKTASLRAKDVVRQLLSFARKTRLEKKPTNIAPIVKESLRMLRASIPASINIRQQIADDIGTIMADPTQINQVLINLCTNAHHAMPGGGTIDITLENIQIDDNDTAQYPELVQGRYVHLIVSDTGHGISQEVVDRIFDPYFTTKDVGKGSGMGLAVVHGIVKEHNGLITVESDMGKGSAFGIFFPVVEEEAVADIAVDEDLPTGNEKILFVDDEDSIVELGRQRLERLGYIVKGVTSPTEALVLFQSKPEAFDLVITDMTMPEMTGDKLVKGILDIRSDIPIILCTGFSEKIDEAKAKEMGVASYIEKPLDKRDFAFKVRRALDEK